jgi:SPP1 family predicted phage head-tail adaptor
MAIDAGKLTLLIKIQNNASPTQDSELNTISNWTDWKTVWAQPLSQTTREFYRMNQQNSEVTRVFRIRYVSGVTAQMRIAYGAEKLEIIGQPENEGERNKSLLISCKAVV